MTFFWSGHYVTNFPAQCSLQYAQIPVYIVWGTISIGLLRWARVAYHNDRKQRLRGIVYFSPQKIIREFSSILIEIKIKLTRIAFWNNLLCLLQLSKAVVAPSHCGFTVHTTKGPFRDDGTDRGEWWSVCVLWYCFHVWVMSDNK